jgi:peptide/nickel transport system substrate-binding protein
MKRVLLTVVTIVAVLLVAWGPAAADEPKMGGTLVYGTGTDAHTLDPQMVTDVPTSRVVMWIHDCLVYRDTDGNLIPSLAESWSVSEDKLNWTFKLREGVKFHDGTPFTAEAVKYSFDRIKDPEIGSPRKSTAAVVEEVEVVDDHTVVFKTSKSFAPFLAQLTAYNLAILNPNQAKKHGKEYAQHPSGTGPFKLESWTPGEEIVLVKNEDYWGDGPYLDKLVVKIVPEDSARVMMLMSDELDVIASVPAIMLDRLKKAKNVKILRKTGFRTIYIGLNTEMEPFTDRKVREAAALAIDAQPIVDGVLGGVGTVGGGFESPVIFGAHQNLEPYPHNPEKAKKLLAEAGYPDGLTVDFYTPTGRYLMDRQVAEAVQAQLKEVGIEAKLHAPDWGTYRQMLDEGDKIPMFLLGKGSPTGDLDLTQTLVTMCGGKMNHFNYCNERVDELIEAQRGIVDQKERLEALAEMQEIVYEDIPLVPLFYEEQLFGARTDVMGVEVYPHEFVSFTHAWIK